MLNTRVSAPVIKRAKINQCSPVSMWKKGFTLVEMVVTLIIVGILAVFAVPRLFDIGDFDARGYHDQALAMLRYAQKTAIAQRTSVFVNIDSGGGTICLTYAADPTCASGTGVLNPADNRWFSKAVPAGVTLSNSQSFFFSGLGRPQPDATVLGPVIAFNIIYDGVSRPIRVERETGYVH